MHICTLHKYLVWSEKSIRLPITWVKNGCTLPCRYKEPNPCLLQKQLVIWTLGWRTGSFGYSKAREGSQSLVNVRNTGSESGIHALKVLRMLMILTNWGIQGNKPPCIHKRTLFVMATAVGAVHIIHASKGSGQRKGGVYKQNAPSVGSVGDGGTLFCQVPALCISLAELLQVRGMSCRKFLGKMCAIVWVLDMSENS